MGKCSVTQRIETVHKLIHAKNKETINKYLKIINLTLYELEKVNKLREMAGNDKIVV